jgi:ribonuclease D
MGILTDPDTYRLEPDEAWRRLKVRSDKPRFLAVLREVAAWREREAQRKDIPRSRVLRDESVMEIAAHVPTTVDELGRTRGFGRSMAEGRYGTELLAAVAKAKALPDSELPRVEPRADLPQGLAPIIELLRVLLRMACEDHDVASRLVANAADLEAIAADDNADVAALKGWRREVFGNAALDLKHGRLALAIAGRRVKLVELTPKE